MKTAQEAKTIAEWGQMDESFTRKVYDGFDKEVILITDDKNNLVDWKVIIKKDKYGPAKSVIFTKRNLSEYTYGVGV